MNLYGYQDPFASGRTGNFNYGMPSTNANYGMPSPQMADPSSQLSNNWNAGYGNLNQILTPFGQQPNQTQTPTTRTTTPGSPTPGSPPASVQSSPQMPGVHTTTSQQTQQAVQQATGGAGQPPAGQQPVQHSGVGEWTAMLNSFGGVGLIGQPVLNSGGWATDMPKPLRLGPAPTQPTTPNTQQQAFNPYLFNPYQAYNPAQSYNPYSLMGGGQTNYWGAPNTDQSLWANPFA